jgi:hypothetical protein
MDRRSACLRSALSIRWRSHGRLHLSVARAHLSAELTASASGRPLGHCPPRLTINTERRLPDCQRHIQTFPCLGCLSLRCRCRQRFALIFEGRATCRSDRPSFAMHRHDRATSLALHYSRPSLPVVFSKRLHVAALVRACPSRRAQAVAADLRRSSGKRARTEARREGSSTIRSSPAQGRRSAVAHSAARALRCSSSGFLTFSGAWPRGAGSATYSKAGSSFHGPRASS